MMKRGAKFLGIIFIGIIVIFMFSEVVSAANPFDFLKGWAIGQSNDIFIKILFTIIVILFVFSIADTLGFFENKMVLFLISVAVGILSTLTMDKIMALSLTNLYSAFGGTLITLLPFVILGMFTIRAVKDGEVQLLVLQHIAWGIFAVFLLYVLATGPGSLGPAAGATEWNWWRGDCGYAFCELITGQNLIIFGTFLLTLFLTFANSFALDRLGATLLRAKAVSAASGMKDIESGIELFRKSGKQIEEPTRRRRPKVM